MPTLTPIGILSSPLVAMRAMIAGSSAFQAWVGVTDTVAAEAHIHLLVAPAEAPRPYALIDFGDFARERVALANGITWQQRPGSNVVIWFQADVSPGAEEPEATIAFCNAVGAVWQDLERASGIYGQKTLAANLIELVVAPVRIEAERRATAGDYFECALSPSFTRQP